MKSVSHVKCILIVNEKNDFVIAPMNNNTQIRVIHKFDAFVSWLNSLQGFESSREIAAAQWQRIYFLKAIFVATSSEYWECT